MDTIFIVEDDTVLREELARLLTLQGYEPRWCDRFEDAAQQALASHAACVVLDLKLPQADGLAICRDIPEYFNGGLVACASKNSIIKNSKNDFI